MRHFLKNVYFVSKNMCLLHQNNDVAFQNNNLGRVTIHCVTQTHCCENVSHYFETQSHCFENVSHYFEIMSQYFATLCQCSDKVVIFFRLKKQRIFTRSKEELDGVDTQSLSDSSH